MITVTMRKNGYKVTGHAGGMRGTDIVCASVSAITQTALIGLRHYAGCHYEMSDGHLDVELYTSNNETEAILYSMYFGIRQIEEQYPEKIKLITRRGLHE
jgi:uncharacterized protein